MISRHKNKSTTKVIINAKQPSGIEVSAIPLLRSDQPSHDNMLKQVHAILMAAHKVTVFCGATSTTRIDFLDAPQDQASSSDELCGDRRLRVPRLFNPKTLKDPKKRQTSSEVLTRVRILERWVSLKPRHRFVEHLFDKGKLARCYTQDISGLQTRDRHDMVESVIELNGSNTYLKCTVCNRRPEEVTSHFDEPLLHEPKVECPYCMLDPSTTRPGCLLPDILLDDEAKEVWGGNQRVDKLKTKDGNCDVLLVLGPRLKSKGAAGVLRALADKVHLFGGTVIYIDWKTLDPNMWRPYIDLHLETDADLWAENYLSNLPKVRFFFVVIELLRSAGSD
ncbi:hypothetical protein FRC08_005584 [Ceratobasidium sp. 394]|nr:hypothetical protein FRC08_005584 [Ceratobasidium sp. 394]KAG9093824.1 hypothetical protein FS749_013671 [Ceratobasidium sp. UAMH 11750]